MEGLNYSLWVTLVLWSVLIAIDFTEGKTNYKQLYFIAISIPAVAILLEYLIMR